MLPPFDLQEPSTFDSAKTDPAMRPPRLPVERGRTRVGRYTILQQVGSDRMGTVHLARAAGPAAQARVVAIKQVHPHLARDPDFSSVFIDQATLASRIHHRNVLPILEMVVEGPDIFLVMEQVDGAGLAALVRAARARQRAIPLPISVALVVDILYGLHAAHETRTQTGAPLQILHRAVSPQNVLVGADGMTRLLEVGVAKAWHATRSGRRQRSVQDSCYLAPEQIRQEPLTRAADIFAASALFWELVTSQPLFTGGGELERMVGVLDRRGLQAPSSVAPLLPQPLDRIILKGLAEDLQRRYPTALAMAEAIERVVRPASHRQVAEWVVETAGSAMFRSAPLLEGDTGVDPPPAAPPARVPTPAARRLPRLPQWVGHLQQVRTRVSIDRRARIGLLAGALLIGTAFLARCPSNLASDRLSAGVQTELAPSNAIIEQLPPVAQPNPEPAVPADPPVVEAALPLPPPPPVVAVQPPPPEVRPPDPPAPVEERPVQRERVSRLPVARPVFARARNLLEEEIAVLEPIEPEVSLVENAEGAAAVPPGSDASEILSEPATPPPDKVKQRRKRAPLVTENGRVPLLE